MCKCANSGATNSSKLPDSRTRIHPGAAGTRPQQPVLCYCAPCCCCPRTDADIVYTVKPAWASYLAFIEEAQADAAFQVELGYSACNSAAVNTGRRRRAGSGVCTAPPTATRVQALRAARQACTPQHVHHAPCPLPLVPAITLHAGNYVALPTRGSIAMFDGWTRGFPEGLAAKENDQQYVERIHDQILRRCTGRSGCIKARDEVSGAGQARGAGLAGRRAVLATAVVAGCLIQSPWHAVLAGCLGAETGPQEEAWDVRTAHKAEAGHSRGTTGLASSLNQPLLPALQQPLFICTRSAPLTCTPAAPPTRPPACPLPCR